MISYPSIEQFRQVKRLIEKRVQFVGLDKNGDPIMDRLKKLPTLKYKGTIKLHGTNSSVVFDSDGSIRFQSRNREISVTDDNYGFANWFSALPESTQNEVKSLHSNGFVLYGEFVGKGINTSSTAVCQLPRTWVIFGARELGEDGKWLDISDWKVPNEHKIYNIFQFPTYDFTIDFENPADSVNIINEKVLEIEKECPVGKYFGISGIGEGLVLKCIEEPFKGGDFMFKAKGAEHSQSKVKTLASVDTEKLKNVEEFVNKVVTEERLMQAWNYLAENKLEQTEKSTGDFIRWVFNDVIKEESDTLEANGLKQKDASGTIAKVAKRWFFEKIQ